MLTCKKCKFESSYLDEVCYYNINGFPFCDELDIEHNAQNPDALAHVLCVECAESFDFDN